MLTINQTVTIERGDGQNLTSSVGKRGKVLKVSGPIVLVQLDDGNIRGCLPFYLQPIVTAESLAARFTTLT